jgi:3-deoxy-D-manno-octulosonic-acid transferase
LVRPRGASTIAEVYFAYNALLLLTLLVTGPWWLLQMLRLGKYRAGLGERLGRVPRRLGQGDGRETIWIHAVSVGEVLAVSRMVEELRARLPGWRIGVSTTTETGQKLARERFGENNVFYFPLDLGFAVEAYLQALRPRLLVLAESEFWPNLLHRARSSGAAVAVVNARVSDRSLPRYLRFSHWLEPVMRDVDVFLAQSEEDARRLVDMGAPRERVQVGGNLKFEVTAPAKAQLADAFESAVQRAGIGPIVVAGSTLAGEDEMLLECFREIKSSYPNALMVLAPRHPRRFDLVAALLAESGLRWQRRSRWDGQQLLGEDVLLLDTIGELAGLYQFADLAFVGGSLVAKGGHNVLEAAQFGVPILVGPHTENFRDIIGIFQRADALRVVTSESLAPAALALLRDDAERERLGRRARQLMRTQQGATERTVALLLQLIGTDAVARSVEAVSEKPA